MGLMRYIDTAFDVRADTPTGKDPDRYSKTLQNYHQLLWSKPLPSGDSFDLSLGKENLLHHASDLGEFWLSSDAITNTYKKSKRLKKAINQITSKKLEDFFDLGCTIGAYIIFPSKRVNGKMTINGARGTSKYIQDRFDLTLECIRLFYLQKESPLLETLNRYNSFFKLFSNFEGYVDFFLLQDLVNETSTKVNFWLPFNNFISSPLPLSVENYEVYMRNVMNFIHLRNQRIDTFNDSNLSK